MIREPFSRAFTHARDGHRYDLTVQHVSVAGERDEDLWRSRYYGPLVIARTREYTLAYGGKGRQCGWTPMAYCGNSVYQPLFDYALLHHGQAGALKFAQALAPLVSLALKNGEYDGTGPTVFPSGHGAPEALDMWSACGHDLLWTMLNVHRISASPSVEVYGEPTERRITRALLSREYQKAVRGPVMENAAELIVEAAGEHGERFVQTMKKLRLPLRADHIEWHHWRGFPSKVEELPPFDPAFVPLLRQEYGDFYED